MAKNSQARVSNPQLAMAEKSEAALMSNTSDSQAQLELLKYQLNPHFLFNTLNAINSLVALQDNDRAQTMIVQLSQFLRYSLDSDPASKIPLEREIRALTQYLAIEQTRFGDRLKLSIEVANDSRRALIPSLLLHPFVENSVKYAIEKSESGGSIKLGAAVTEKRLHLRVSDSGPKSQPSQHKQSNNDGRGLTLNESIARLKHFYDDDFTLNLINEPGGGLTSEIVIPLEIEK